MSYLAAPPITVAPALSSPGPADPRAAMAARLPRRLQPFLTWLTAKPAPGETAPDLPGSAFVLRAGLLLLLGALLGVPALAAARPSLLDWAWLALGLTVITSGLGLFQVVVFHHCSHGTVFATRARNRAAGRLVSAILLFKRFDDYQREHMLHHSAKKLLTEEDEFAGFVFEICRLDPAVPKRELWRRVLVNLVSPTFHGRFLLRRLRSSLFSGDRGHDLAGWAVWGGLLGLALATGTLAAFAVLWVLPVTVLLQQATVLRILCEHRFPDAALIAMRDRSFVCEATMGVFPGVMPPDAPATSASGFARWVVWWADMLTVQLFARVFFLPGDAPCHDFHHRRPATRRWTRYAHARQSDADAGSPGFPQAYSEIWGLFRAVDHNLATLAATPRSALPHMA